MTRLYFDLETYRPDEDGAFLDERIIAAGLIVDRTPYNVSSLEENVPPMIFTEWKGQDEKRIVELVLKHLRDSLTSSRFTEVCGYNILRYDIPMLICKMVHLLGEDPHKAARQWWDPLSVDLQQWMLAASGGRFKGTSLGNVVSLAKKHGLNPPEYTDSGSSIRELYPKDKFKEIEHHLIQDLKIIRWLHIKGARELVKLGSQQNNFFEI